jgi:endoglucanase
MTVRTSTLRAVAAVAVPLLLAAGCSGGGGGDGVGDVDADGYVSVSDLATTPSAGRVSDGTGAAIEARYSFDDPASVTVSVEAPSGAAEMQLSVDATYGDAEWQPVAGEVKVPVADTGFVEVFVRFRSGEGGEPSAPLVAGVLVDPAWVSATNASVDSPHAAAEIGLAAPDVLAVRVDTGRVRRGGQEAYSFSSPVAGDELRDGDDGATQVWRDGGLYGTQVAVGLDVLMRPDTVLGYPVSAASLDDAGGYSVASDDDDAFGGGVEPLAVRRVTRPAGSANVASAKLVLPAVHDVYLRLPGPPVAGSTYTISFPDDAVAPSTFTFEPASSRSFAVHANQLGYRPGDALKVAYVSAWDGAAIELPPSLEFQVVDAVSGDVVYEGTSSSRETGADGEVGRGDLTGTPVQELDFSALDAPGTYRVCVTLLGCSEDFDLSDTSTWRRAAVAVARAMFHQRSGIAMAEPYTAVDRPRGFHPDDGVQVRQATVSQMDIDAAEAGAFDTLVASATDDIVDGAYGGHFDAGDWDRRVQHLSFLRAALDLVDLHPETWATLDLGIPESGDAVPDILDEGLWDLDLYRRMQLPDGGIRGGIESDEHPLPRETSWTQTQQVFAFAPDAESSYVYAGVAAEAARVLAAYDAARADEYRVSALAAMNWAEDNPVSEEVSDETADDITGARAAASAALFRLTGDPQWQDAFLDSTEVDNGALELLGCELLEQCDALWIYANTDQPGVRADVKQHAIDTFRNSATIIGDAQDSTLFGWSMDHPAVPLVWGLGPSVPKTVGLLRAYALTGEARYCRAAQRSSTFSLGANPLDTVFLTGLGERNVEHPLIVDNINGGVPVWPGTPVYGMHQLNDTGDETWVAQYQLRPAGSTPDPEGVPYLQKWWDVSSVPMFNEFTVHQSHTAALYAYGSLAALDCRA